MRADELALPLRVATIRIAGSILHLNCPLELALVAGLQVSQSCGYEQGKAGLT